MYNLPRESVESGRTVRLAECGGCRGGVSAQIKVEGTGRQWGDRVYRDWVKDGGGWGQGGGRIGCLEAAG